MLIYKIINYLDENGNTITATNGYIGNIINNNDTKNGSRYRCRYKQCLFYKIYDKKIKELEPTGSFFIIYYRWFNESRKN